MAGNAGVQKVVTLYERLKSRDSARNVSYDEVLKFYAGDTLKQTQRQGFLSGITKALSSIFTPSADDEDASLNVPINLVKPAIENKVAFLSLPPTVKVIAPPESLFSTTGAAGPGPPAPGALPPTPANPAAPQAPPGSEPPSPLGPVAATAPTATDSSDFADRLEQVIAALLAMSNLPKRCRDVAWGMSAMDGAVIGVWPDFRHNCPRIFTRTPQDFYPVSYDPDGLELSMACWMQVMNGDDIQARWGNKNYIGRDDVEVIQMIDEESFYTVLDNNEWAHPPVKNLMGLVPIVCVGNLSLPGMIFGSTDIKDAIPVAKQINYHMSLIDEMAKAMVNPTIVIRDPLNVPPDLAIGQGGVATMGPQGSAEVLGPISLPNAFWTLSGQLQGWFDTISDNPAVLRSEGGGSIITGKGFNAQLGPVAARMQTRSDIAMSAWKQAIKYMLLMWANFPGANGPLKLSGSKDKADYYIEATPQEFVLDGKMWTEVEVFLEAQSYIDRQGVLVELMQLYQNEMIDWESAADNNPFITNKKRVHDNIDKDRQWKATGLALAQQAAQSPMTANPAMQDQGATNYQLERGYMGETGPPAAPTGQIPEAPGQNPAAAPQDTTNQLVADLQAFFASIPKLRGSVWFGGDPLMAPEKFATDTWTVTVWISDPQDQGTITRAAQKVPEVYGHIVFRQGAPDPNEKTIQVAGGAPPVTPGPGMPAAGGMPPELAAMAAGAPPGPTGPPVGGP